MRQIRSRLQSILVDGLMVIAGLVIGGVGAYLTWVAPRGAMFTVTPIALGGAAIVFGARIVFAPRPQPAGPGPESDDAD